LRVCALYQIWYIEVVSDFYPEFQAESWKLSAVS
jgi:hypothetical protein